MAAFTIAASVILWYAIPDGSYDIVRRQEDAIAVWWVVGLGAAIGLLPRTKLRRESLWVLVPLALLVAWTAMGLLWTSSAERTLAEVVRVTQYAGMVLLVWCLVSPATWRPAAAGVAAAAVVVCGFALASRLVPERFPDTVAEAFQLKRLSYPLGYWNAVAAWGAMTIAMVLVWSAHARSLPARALGLASVPVAVLVVYLTYSRAAVGGTAIALLAALTLSANRWTVAAHALVAAGASAVAVATVRGRPEIADGTGTEGASAVVSVLFGGMVLCVLATGLTHVVRTDRWGLRARAARVVTLTLVALAVVALLTLGRGPASDAWDDFRDTDIPTTSTAELKDPSVRLTSLKGTRYDVWSSAVGAFRDAPLKGIGPGTFEFHWNRDGGGQFVRDAHSVYLEQAAELGVPGAALTIAALLALGVLGVLARFRVRDPSRAGAAAALCAAFVVYLFHAGLDWMWESTAVSVLAIAAIALAAGFTDQSRAAGSSRLRVGLASLALCACAVALPGLGSTTKVRASQEAFRRGDQERAREQADSAVSRQPAAATPYVQRGLVRWADGDHAGAARDLRSARRHEPLDWRHPLLLARLEAERGRTRASIRAFRNAKRLRPASPFFVALPSTPPAGAAAPPP